MKIERINEIQCQQCLFQRTLKRKVYKTIGDDWVGRKQNEPRRTGGEVGERKGNYECQIRSVKAAKLDLIVRMEQD